MSSSFVRHQVWVVAALLQGCGSEVRTEVPAPVAPAAEVVPTPVVAPVVQASAAVAAPAPVVEAAPDAAAAEPVPAPPASDAAFLDEDGEVVTNPALAHAERLDAGPWVEEVDIAAIAGFVDVEDEFAVVTQLDYQRRVYVLMSIGRGEVDGAARSDIWLARLESRHGEGDAMSYRRVAAVRLYEGAIASGGMETQGDECSAQSEIRVRDLDGDGALEVTAIAAFIQPTVVEEECGAIAYLVRGDDLATQARFSRQYHYAHSGADGDTSEMRDAAWQVRDVDGDGHADLRVTETWRYRDAFEGDYIGGGETASGQHAHGSDRRTVDCLWVPTEDVWRCPEPAPGQVLFRDVATRASTRGTRPW